MFLSKALKTLGNQHCGALKTPRVQAVSSFLFIFQNDAQKLLLITYKSLNGLALVYINELLHHYTPCRSLRSIDSNLLVIPKATTVTYGDRSFAVIMKIWNQLPLAIRQSTFVDSFKRALKTYLFQESSLFLVISISF